MKVSMHHEKGRVEIVHYFCHLEHLLKTLVFIKGFLFDLPWNQIDYWFTIDVVNHNHGLLRFIYGVITFEAETLYKFHGIRVV